MVKRQLKPSFSTEGARDDLAALRATVEALLNVGYFSEEEADRYRVRVHLPVQLTATSSTAPAWTRGRSSTTSSSA